MPVTLVEVTTIARDILRVELHDGEITMGPLHQMDTPAANYGDFQAINPNTLANEWGSVVGPNKDWIRFGDKHPDAFLNRTAVMVAANWSLTGSGLTVTKVYEGKSMPRRTSTFTQHATTGTIGAVSTCQMRHYRYLKLSGNLSAGSYTLVPPPALSLASVPFVFNDKTTRCAAIRCTQGYMRRGDAKSARLAYKVHFADFPYGAVDYSAFPEFHIIDEHDAIVFTGPIVQRCSPTSGETGFTNQYYVDTSTPYLTLTGITQAAAGVVSYIGDGFVPVNGDRIYARGVGGMVGLERWTFEVTNIDLPNKRFQLGPNTANASGTTASVNTTGQAAYVSNFYQTHGNELYLMRQANRTGTNNYELDFSDAELPPNYYRIYIPNLGVSDTFRIDEAAWHLSGQMAAAGVYHLWNGIAFDGRFGYTLGTGYRDGVNGCTIFHSSLPACITSETGGNFVLSHHGGNPSLPWNTGVRATDWFGGCMDAGDHDWFPQAHHRGPAVALQIWYDCLPAASRNVQWGIPKASETIGAEYAGTDHLSDIFHLVAYMADPLRRFQLPNGGVPGGLGVYDQRGNNAGGGGNRLEPRDITTAIPFLYAEEYPHTYAHACVGYMLARILAAEGLTTLATSWGDSADAAYARADELWNSIEADGVEDQATYLDAGFRINHKPARLLSAIASANTSTDVITLSSTISNLAFPSGLATGHKVFVLVTSGLTGVTNSTAYWANKLTNTTITLHNSRADALTGASKVDITATGTGTLYSCVDHWDDVMIASADPATDVITTSTAHGFITGQGVVAFHRGGTLPVTPAPPIGFSAALEVFVRNISPTTLSLHNSASGASSNTGRYDITASGTGALNGGPYARYLAIKKNTGNYNGKTMRGAAAAAKFRYDGDPVAEAITIATQSGGTVWDAIAKWEYQAAANNATATQYRVDLSGADLGERDYSVDTTVCYRSLGVVNPPAPSPGGFRPGLGQNVYQCVAAHTLNPSQQNRLTPLQFGCQYIEGANQTDQSLLSGIGQRWTLETLHTDSRNGAQNPPLGMTLYNNNSHQSAGGFGCEDTGSTISSFNSVARTSVDPAFVNNSDDKCIHPNTRANPQAEQRTEAFNIVNEMEFTIDETLWPALIARMYLDRYDGNTQTELGRKYIRRTVS